MFFSVLIDQPSYGPLWPNVTSSIKPEVRVRTIPSWKPNTHYPKLWYLTIPIPNTNTNTGSDVICCTDSLHITTQISVVKGYPGSYTTPGCEIRHLDIPTSTASLLLALQTHC